jgi:hypothetical protein
LKVGAGAEKNSFGSATLAQSIAEGEEDRRGNIVMKRLQMAIEETEGCREDSGL